MSQKIKVLVVDCHNLVREGLRRILAAESTINVVGATGGGGQLLKLVDTLNPTVILLDASLPEAETMTQRITKKHPETNILILATHCQIEQALALLAEGATGYICKDATLQDLLTAVQHAARNEMFLDSTVARAVIDQLTHAQSQAVHQTAVSHTPLTQREMDVLHLLCEGQTDKEIAKSLCLSTRTVNGHLRHIYAKLGVHSRTEAMHIALEKGWVKLVDT